MLKINELNKVFKEKTFFTSAGSYNDLLGHAQSLARTVDAKIALVESSSHAANALQKDIKALRDKIDFLEYKFVRAVLRDPKTGRYLKRKK